MPVCHRPNIKTNFRNIDALVSMPLSWNESKFQIQAITAWLRNHPYPQDRHETAMKKKASKKPKAASRPSGKSAGKSRDEGIDASGLEDLIGFNVRLALAELRRSYFLHVWGGNMRPGLASLLRLVAKNHGASQVELARAMHVDKATLVALMDTAEEEGWLKRQRSSTDRRRHEIILTPEGEKAVKELARQTLRHEKRFRSRFTDKELEKFLEYLRRIYQK